MIEPGKHVKYFLRNGMVLEGICEKDGGSEVVLKALDGKSLMILHKPAEDIMMTKVVLVEETEEPAQEEEEPYQEPQPTDHVEFHTRVTNKLQEIQEADGNPELAEKSLGELRDMVQEQERQIITNQKKEHFGTAGAAKMTHYSTPYTPQRTVGRRVVPRSAYQPGTMPNWVYGRPPVKGK